MTDTDISAEARAAFRHWGRIGGLTASATHDTSAQLAQARAAQEAKWLQGHGCRACGPRIEIPAAVTDSERQRRAKALRKRHYVLLSARRHRARR